MKLFFKVLILYFAVIASFGNRAAFAQNSAEQWDEKPVAVLQALDKVTARVSRLAVLVGETHRFGQIAITVETCRKRPPTMPPESVAFLEVDEYRPDQKPHRIFSGWMFASSPALSALEHPVYDVWVLDCIVPPKGP